MKNKIVLTILILSMIALIFSGCGSGNPVTPPSPDNTEDSEGSESEINLEDFTLFKDSNPESNLLIVAGFKKGDKIIAFGKKDNAGNPSGITQTVFVTEDSNAFVVEIDDNGLLSRLINKEGNTVIFDNYTSSTVDTYLYDSNEALIGGPVTVEIDPEKIQELQQLYNQMKNKYKDRWSIDDTYRVLEYTQITLSVGSCVVMVGVDLYFGGFLSPIAYAVCDNAINDVATFAPIHNYLDDYMNPLSESTSATYYPIESANSTAAIAQNLGNIASSTNTLFEEISISDTYTITASAGPNGTISPSGDITVNQGSDKSFTITPDTGYSIDDVLVDGSSVGAVSSYTFTKVTKDHTISATFISAAPQPSLTGKIAFGSLRDGDFEIYIMNADGSNQTRLTNNRGWDPCFSPDGNKIAFVSDRDGNIEIYVMDADGSNQTNLTNNQASDGDPCFSPDGIKIAFGSLRDGDAEIYVMDADGSNQTRLTNNWADDLNPCFSPDGTKIAFTSYRDGKNEVYVMDADGSNQTNLTNNRANDGETCFSPDGTKIAFTSDRDGNYEIYVMNADGSNQTRLTNNPTLDNEPSWGP